ncbi:AAA domain-containing protein [Micromonospora sp. Llam0]|uniref:AAA family ATPase n=1 Tax=Micromonospora sp. Llam0 TaxID=2485143 RepID=UPI000F45F740|nr:AAA family ATPase [Micromonospora sp. Llam0]ROO62040.1 AAA domain-containing protein [Micromonospora sp. Llam0]
MRLAISGTYSSGKTRTVMALSHYTGIPRTLALTIREIMPQAVPGKRLAEVTPAEFVQLMMRRHVGRAVHEALLGASFISDGSSLQEWLYGKARVLHGMNPNETADADDTAPVVGRQEMAFFEQVVDQFGHAMKQHVKGAFDAFVHLRHELPIAEDGHRPMNAQFRDTIDRMLLATLDELRIPYHEVSGPFADRLDAIVDLFGLPRVRAIEESIALADADYAQIDKRLETERSKVPVAG